MATSHPVCSECKPRSPDSLPAVADPCCLGRQFHQDKRMDTEFFYHGPGVAHSAQGDRVSVVDNKDFLEQQHFAAMGKQVFQPEVSGVKSFHVHYVPGAAHRSGCEMPAQEEMRHQAKRVRDQEGSGCGRGDICVSLFSS